MSWEPRYSPERNCSSLSMAESLHSSDQKSSSGGALSKAGHVSIDNGKLLAVFWRSLMDHQLL